MSNMTKIALSAAIILSTAFSALTAANASASREQAVCTENSNTHVVMVKPAEDRI